MFQETLLSEAASENGVRVASEAESEFAELKPPSLAFIHSLLTEINSRHAPFGSC